MLLQLLHSGPAWCHLPLGGDHAAVQSCSLGGWTGLKAGWERGVLREVGGLSATEQVE